MNGLILIGGSYAALNLAAEARRAGYAEPITLVTEERWLPYHRPPLSKAFLSGKMATDGLQLRGESFYRDQNIDVVFETRVTGLDARSNRIETSAGKSLSFDRLAIATGTRARSLPISGSDLPNVQTLRSLDDALAIQALATEAQKVVIIGGGFIGLELAASLASLDKAVTIIEGFDRVLARVTKPSMSKFIANEHAKHGVSIVCNKTVSGIEAANGKATAVIDGQGDRYFADLIIVAIGAIPNTEFLEPVGIAGRNGVTVDRFGRTVDPRIFAAGDCALHPSTFAGTQIRLESVQNATDQAKCAGAAVAGVQVPYETVPWFWSDQYSLKLQMVGLSADTDKEVIRGSFEDCKFSVFYFRGDVLRGIDSINAPADHMLGRRLLTSRAKLTPEQAADSKFDLKSLL